MNTVQIINEIKQLSVEERRKIIRLTRQSLTEETLTRNLSVAAEQLYGDYTENEELTAFTGIDQDDFHQTS